jgi:hypothetical protein
MVELGKLNSCIQAGTSIKDWIGNLGGKHLKNCYQLLSWRIRMLAYYLLKPGPEPLDGLVYICTD